MRTIFNAGDDVDSVAATRRGRTARYTSISQVAHMPSARCPMRQPFTVAVCTACGAEVTPQLLQMLRNVIRRCPHGILVMTECLIGQLTCATRPAHEGAMVLLQLCSTERTPTAPVQWLGPITDLADARLICEWIERGDWDRRELPTQLRAETTLQRSSIRN
jgi:hypothetical protein